VASSKEITTSKKHVTITIKGGSEDKNEVLGSNS
jgi:hypothetical protein